MLTPVVSALFLIPMVSITAAVILFGIPCACAPALFLPIILRKGVLFLRKTVLRFSTCITAFRFFFIFCKIIFFLELLPLPSLFLSGLCFLPLCFSCKIPKTILITEKTVLLRLLDITPGSFRLFLLLDIMSRSFRLLLLLDIVSRSFRLLLLLDIIFGSRLSLLLDIMSRSYVRIPRLVCTGLFPLCFLAVVSLFGTAVRKSIFLFPKFTRRSFLFLRH